jgi:serine/threonine protein kinase
MAPEIWEGKAYNEKVDIWSLGIVMYYLLTGSHPFEGESETLVQNIREQEFEFPEDMFNFISSKAINLLKTILHKDPDLRPTAKEVACHIWLNHIDTIPRDSFIAE